MGTSNITASLSGVTSPVDVLTVTAATLQSIAVTPANPSIGKGLTQQFTATGTYSDTSTANVTAPVTWNSSEYGRGDHYGAGLATGVAVGTSNITASLSGVTSPVDVLTVTAATLQSIAVTPANPTITKGGRSSSRRQERSATTGRQNLTSAVTWNSSNNIHGDHYVGGVSDGSSGGDEQRSRPV